MTTATPARMTITAFTDPTLSTKADAKPNPYQVWINPASYTRRRTVKYNDRQAQGSSGTSPGFNRIACDDITLDLMFDATGVIPPIPTASYRRGVADGVEQFIALTATTNGTVHSPNYLTLSWAQLQFDCVLTSLTIAYTLFRPDGTPLRAKLSVGFQSFTSEARLAKLANKTSPDLTHLVTVVAGDTLPMLCHRVYGDSRYYLHVARANNLLGFRRLVPGTQLVFPPLSGTGA